jgi:hypothetical protein
VAVETKTCYSAKALIGQIKLKFKLKIYFANLLIQKTAGWTRL